MKKFFYIIMAVVALTILDSCLGKSVYDEYKDWRQKNDAWYEQQVASGQYTTIIASWDPSAQVLIRWHNDTMLTKDNLKPLITSTVDVKYHLSVYDGTPADSSQPQVTVGQPYQQQPQYAGQQPANAEPCPPTNLAWAVISTVLCCLPAGIVAIIYALKVTNKYREGDIEGAKRASETGAWWCIASIVLGIICQPFLSMLPALMASH